MAYPLLISVQQRVVPFRPSSGWRCLAWTALSSMLQLMAGVQIVDRSRTRWEISSKSNSPLFPCTVSSERRPGQEDLLIRFAVVLGQAG